MGIKKNLLMTGLFYLSLVSSAQAQVKVGEPAPPFKAMSFDHELFDLAKFRGKTLVIHFWATWCPNCREELPALNRFYQKNRAHLEMFSVSLDRPHDREAAMKVMREMNFTGGMLSEVKENGFGTPPSLPATYVISPQGLVLKIILTETPSLWN